MLLETVFQYRTLIGKCELGVGLEWEEIDLVSRIEHAFAAPVGEMRRFKRHAIELTAMMRGDQIHDRVEIIEIGPGGLVCTNAPFVTKGELVEIVIESGGAPPRAALPEGVRMSIDVGEDSFRFMARGVWLREDGNDFRVGLRFVGIPVNVHKVQISEHVDDVVDRIGGARLAA